MILELLFIFLVTLALTWIFERVGQFVRPFYFPYQTSSSFDPFLNIVAGLFTVVLIWSVIWTRGQTVFGALIFPILMQISEIREYRRSNTSVAWFKAFALSLAICSLLKLLMPFRHSIETDVFLYSQKARFLSVYGYESIYAYFSELAPSLRGATPYHYFEMWVGNFLIPILRLPATIVLQHAVYPWLVALSIFGWSRLADSEKPRAGLWSIMLFAALTLWRPSQVLNAFGNPWPIFMELWTRPNFIPYVLVFAIVGERVNAGDWRRALQNLLWLPLLSVTAAPAVFITVGLCAIGLWIKQPDERTRYRRLLFSAFVIGLYLILFYRWFGIPDTRFYDFPGITGIPQKMIVLWKAIVFVSGQLTIRVIALAGVATFVLVQVFRKVPGLQRNWLIAMGGALGLIFAGVGVFQTVPYLNDTYQFPYPGYVALWFLFLFVLVNGICSLDLKPRLIFLVLAGLVGIGSSWNEWYVARPEQSLGEYHTTQKGIPQNLVSQIQRTFTPGILYRVGFFLSDEEAKQLNPRYRVALTYTPWNWTAYLHDGLKIEPLTPTNILYATGSEHELALARAFNDLLPFYQEGWKDVPSISKYIREQKIDYVFALETVWPSEEFIARPLKALIVR